MEEGSNNGTSPNRYRRSRDPRQCRLAPDENSFNLRKSKMKLRIAKEQKLREARREIEARRENEARRRRNSTRRNISNNEIEESGMTEDFQSSGVATSSEDTEIVPFAAAKPLPNSTNTPSENVNDGIIDPNVTLTAEVLSTERTSQNSDHGSNEYNDNRTGDNISVLSIGAEATPIHDTHGDGRVENLERGNEQLREQLNQVRRQSSSENKRNRQTCPRKCKLISIVSVVFLIGGGGVFFAIRGAPKAALPLPAKRPSLVPTLAPTINKESSEPKTQPPTQELVYDPPSLKDCEIVSSGGRLDYEEGLDVNRYNVELEVELRPNAKIEDELSAIANATQRILIPDLVGCFGQQRNLLSNHNYPLRRTLKFNPRRYAIANVNATVRRTEDRKCEGTNGGSCFGIDMILHLAAKNSADSQFVFQSLIIEIFGIDDLARSLNLDAHLSSIKLVDVKINVQTEAPSDVPTKFISGSPSKEPSSSPSFHPSLAPTKNPSKSPSVLPTQVPSFSPTGMPSQIPSNEPTDLPTNGMPSNEPSTRTPTDSPTTTLNASVAPNDLRSQRPTSNQSPTTAPTATQAPTVTGNPTPIPLPNPTQAPIIMAAPTRKPSSAPTQATTSEPGPQPEPTSPISS